MILVRANRGSWVGVCRAGVGALPEATRSRETARGAPSAEWERDRRGVQNGESRRVFGGPWGGVVEEDPSRAGPGRDAHPSSRLSAVSNQAPGATVGTDRIIPD